MDTGNYFDGAAAVPVDRTTLERFSELTETTFANQESSGRHGADAAKAVLGAAKRLAAALTLPSTARVFFCNTGTDAVQSLFQLLPMQYPQGGAVLLTAGEHASVRAAAQQLPSNFRVSEIPLDATGGIELSEFRRLCRTEDDDLRLVAVHQVQPETGRIQDLRVLRPLLRETAPRALFFSDSIQGACKLSASDSSDADFLTISGAKLGLPGGAALVYPEVFEKQVQALRFQHHRVGRIHPALAILLAERAECLCASSDATRLGMERLREHLMKELHTRIPGKFRRTVPDALSAPWFVHLLLDGSEAGLAYQGAIVTRALSQRGFSVASGSACDAESNEPSRVLRAMKIPRSQAYSALRISLLPCHTPDDLRRLADELAKTLAEY